MVSHFRRILTVVPFVAAAMGYSSLVSAQDDDAVYAAGIHCAALHSFMSGALEDDDAESAAVFADSATRFLALAIVRDEESAEDDMMQSLDSLIERVESLGDDEQGLADLLTGAMERCDAFRQNMSEEYDAVELTD